MDTHRTKNNITLYRPKGLYLFISTYILFLIPNIAFAAPVTDLASLLEQLGGILDIIVGFIIGLAVFVIIWGIFTYVVQAANEEKRHEAAQFIIWGVFSVFIMLSIWGIIALITNIFDFSGTISPTDLPKAPQFQE